MAPPSSKKTEAGIDGRCHEDEQTEADGPTEDAGVGNEEDQADANHDNTEYSAQEAELATPAISLRSEFSKSVNPHHHTEEDEENAENWELDDGFADREVEETIDGDELDIALVGEPDSACVIEQFHALWQDGIDSAITSKRSSTQ